MKTRVLFIDTPLDPPGGGQMSLMSMIQFLDKTEIEPLVFIPNKNSFTNWLEDKNIPYKILPPKNLFLAIKNLNPSIVHCNSPTTKYTFWSASISKFLRIPFIWHVRVTKSSKWRDKIISSLCSKVIVISDAVNEKFTWIVDKNKVEKIPNGVDISIFKPGLDIEYLFSEFKIKKNMRIVGIFSRLDPWKGHLNFLECSRIIKDNIRDTNFLVVGEGEKEFKKRLIKNAETLGLENDVIFTGFRKDIPELMNFSDIVVNTSIEAEAFGRVIIEAMACEKAVVATRMGGVVEIIKDNVTGILVPANNIPALAHACVYLLKNKEKALQMGQNGRERVEKYFSAEQNAKKIEQIYEKLIRHNL